MGLLALVAAATTMWSGNFAPLTTDAASARFSVNYPRPGAGEICGIEVKTDVMVLSELPWRSLAGALVVTESHDDGAESPVAATITRDYTPRLFYRFTTFASDYATLTVRPALSGQTLRDAFAQSFGVDRVAAVGVSASCL
jgi:hypothetical protein